MKHQELIRQMTLEEKCSLLSGRDIWSTKPIPRLSIGSIFLADGPSGLRKQLGEGDHLGLNASQPATCWPTAATVAASWDPALAQQIGSMVGREAVSQGVNVVLGPALNIKRSALCGRNFEYFSEDPVLSGKLAAGYIQGMQSQGVAACPKHFAVNSQELRRMASDSVLDERTLREIYLTGFEIAVKQAQPKSIMSSYNLINGTYANENPHLLQDILIKEWGFGGTVVTDWGGSNDHVEGVRQGSHLEMPGTGGDSDRQLVNAVQQGILSETLVDQRCDELLELILSTLPATADPRPDFDVQAHHDFACEAAAQSIVLLKNEAHLLPLAPGCKVAVIGDFAATARYQGAGSSIVNPTRLESLLDVLPGFRLESAGYAQGYQRLGGADEALKQEAVRLAENADVVLFCFGLPEISETEGLDRDHARLPENQIELLKAVALANPHVVGLLSAGSMVEMPWLNCCRSLVYGCLGGQAGAAAALQVITGQVCPSGKLAETFPLEYTDTPVSHYYPGQQRSAEYREGLYVGYRSFETVQAPVRFPFGFGLSYTSFEYSNLNITSEGVCFTVTNTGAVPGAEIAQLYIGCPASVLPRPAKELKGFSKVHLAPGESRSLCIPFEETTFRCFDAVQNKWVIETAQYKVMVGASVADIRLSGSLSLTGQTLAAPANAVALECYYSGRVQQVSDEAFAALLGRPVPTPDWQANGLLGMNDAICQMYYAKNGLARLVYKLLTYLKNRSVKKGQPDLNILFIYNMPFRGIAKMTGGILTMEMTESLLVMVNGHFFKGLHSLARAYFQGKKHKKKTKNP